MIQDLINCSIIAFMCAVCGFVYTALLTDPDQIFDPLYRCLDRNLKKKGHIKLFNVLIGCEKCVSGEMALWTLVFLWLRKYIVFPLLADNELPDMIPLWIHTFYPLNCIYTISLAIFSAWLLNRFYTWAKKN